MPNLIGPDVSFYQDDNATQRTINFAMMKLNAGFVIIRAGQNVWGDPDFKHNWQAAKSAGLPRGSYWFYDSRIEPKHQADLYVSLFEGDFGELPLFCDFEDTYKGNYGEWKDWYTFIERLKVLAPKKEIGIYTGYYYWLEHTVQAGIPAASMAYFKQYPLWVARYQSTQPLVPIPWTDWTLWQFTDNGDGSLYGVESKNIDLNYYNGDMDSFRSRFKIRLKPNPMSKTVIKSLLVEVDGEQIMFTKRGENGTAQRL